MKGRLWGRESLFMWALLGNLEEGSSIEDFESWMKGLWDGVLLSQEALWRGPWGGLLYWGIWKMRFLRDMQMPCRRAPLFIGALLGNWWGFICWDFWEKWIVYLSTFVNPEVTQVLSLSEALTSLRHTYLGSFFLDPEDNRKLSIRAIWSLVEGTRLL